MTADISSILESNYRKLRAAIEQACARAGRNPGEITLVWVSKTRSIEEITAALELGAAHFGENKAREVLEKFPLPTQKPYDLHFIGRLQSNKVRKVLPLCRTLHSVDSLDLMRRIDRIGGELGLLRDLFLQVNVSGESSKTGFPPESVADALEQAASLKHVNLLGLMTMAPHTDNTAEIRHCFRGLAGLRNKLLEETLKSLDRDVPSLKNFGKLSMGMSNDFELAIEEGSHYIRIGTNLFGPR